MTKTIDKPLADMEKKFNAIESKMNDIKRQIDGYKVAYNALSKSLPTIKKMPE